jgi:hypothetical protein
MPYSITRYEQYCDRKKKFLYSIIDKGLVQWFLDPKNKDHEPFVSIKIFKYDPSKMKNLVEKTRYEIPNPEFRHRVDKSIKETTHVKDKSNPHSGQPDYTIKVLNRYQTISSEIITKEVPFNPEVYCHIESNEIINMLPVYTINVTNKMLIEGNSLIFPELKTISDELNGSTIIEYNGSINQSINTPNMTKALRLIKTTPISTYNCHPIKEIDHPRNTTTYVDDKGEIKKIMVDESTQYHLSDTAKMEGKVGLHYNNIKSIYNQGTIDSSTDQSLLKMFVNIKDVDYIIHTDLSTKTYKQHHGYIISNVYEFDEKDNIIKSTDGATMTKSDVSQRQLVDSDLDEDLYDEDDSNDDEDDYDVYEYG